MGEFDRLEHSIGYESSVEKHAQHDQSTHGRRGARGTGDKWDVGNPNNTYSKGKIDKAKYRALGAKDRIRVLRFALSKYREQYKPVADAKNRSAFWKKQNSAIGALEGKRRARVNQAEKVRGKDQRKLYHWAISLQEQAAKAAQLRDAA